MKHSIILPSPTLEQVAESWLAKSCAQRMPDFTRGSPPSYVLKIAVPRTRAKQRLFKALMESGIKWRHFRFGSKITAIFVYACDISSLDASLNK